jgi:oligoribonuclease NrnB/cAMP/cGMP phosphodiesterase (DHH superfamily)
MGRSGCQITWDYFFDSQPRPFFIDYIGDRDLWTWKLPNSKEINTGLYEMGYIDSRNLNKLTELLDDEENKLKELESIGKMIENKNKKDIDCGVYNAIEAKFKFKKKEYRLWLGGNINPNLKSEFGNTLCSKPFADGGMPDFSAVWQYDPKSDDWWISLRGVESRSPDLSVISSSFGGGGHPMASGITIKSPSKGLKELFIY